MSTEPADAAYQALAAYEDLGHLPAQLAELRGRLSAGYRTQPTPAALSPERLAAAGRLAAAERWDAQVIAARGLAPIGASAAPLDIGLLDCIRDIELDLADLEAAIIDRVAPALRPAAHAGGRIRRIRDLLGRAAQHDDLARHVAAEARRLTRRAAIVLGDAQPLVRITTMRCSGCDCLSLRLDLDAETLTCFNPPCELHRVPLATNELGAAA